jgi:hypothetical protein
MESALFWDFSQRTRDADNSLVRPGSKQTTSISKSTWIMDPTRLREMLSCSAIDLAEIRRSSKISSWIWSVISWVVGLKTYQHPGRMVILYRRCGINCRSYLKGPSSSWHSSWTAWPLNRGPIGCPETSLRNYHCTLRKLPEERRSVDSCFFLPSVPKCRNGKLQQIRPRGRLSACFRRRYSVLIVAALGYLGYWKGRSNRRWTDQLI